MANQGEVWMTNHGLETSYSLVGKFWKAKYSQRRDSKNLNLAQRNSNPASEYIIIYTGLSEKLAF